MTELTEFAKTENKRLEEDRQAALGENGYAPFFKLPEGESVLHFEDVEPRVNKNYPNDVIFRIRHSDIEYDYSVNTKSPLYKGIIGLIAEGFKDIKVLRVGKTKENTRYSVMKA